MKRTKREIKGGEKKNRQRSILLQKINAGIHSCLSVSCFYLQDLFIFLVYNSNCSMGKVLCKASCSYVLNKIYAQPNIKYLL